MAVVDRAPGSSARSRRRCCRTGRDVMLITDPRYVDGGRRSSPATADDDRPRRRPSRRRPSRGASAPPDSRAGDGAAGAGPHEPSPPDDAPPPDDRAAGETTTTTTPPTTTTSVARRSRRRDTGQFSGQGADDAAAGRPARRTRRCSGASSSATSSSRPAATTRWRRRTSRSASCATSISRSSSEGPLLEVAAVGRPRPPALRQHHHLPARRPRPARRTPRRPAADVRLARPGPAAAAVPRRGRRCSRSSDTLFEDLRPAGVTLQVVLALAAAAGAGGRAAEGRARRVRARPAVRPQRRHAARLVVDLDGPRRLRRRLRRSSITVRPPWWLAAIFTGLGAAVGEAVGAGDPRVHRRGATRSTPHYGVVVGVVGDRRRGAQPRCSCPSGAGACASRSRSGRRPARSV